MSTGMVRQPEWPTGMPTGMPTGIYPQPEGGNSQPEGANRNVSAGMYSGLFVYDAQPECGFRGSAGPVDTDTKNR
jgi:hypothetical protein